MSRNFKCGNGPKRMRDPQNSENSKKVNFVRKHKSLSKVTNMAQKFLQQISMEGK